MTTDPNDLELTRRVCALISDAEAPYAHTIHAQPGQVYESNGPPFPPLTVVESVTTPIKELLYHRQTVTADIHPGEEPVRISVNRMVGVLEDDREVCMGEVWALPDAILTAAERGPQKCAACGVLIREVPTFDDKGLPYHKGCAS